MHLHNLNTYKWNNQAFLFGCSYFQSHKYTYYNRLPELSHHCGNEKSPPELRLLTLCSTSVDGMAHTAAPRIRRGNLRHKSWLIQQLHPLTFPKNIGAFFPPLVLEFLFSPSIPVDNPEQCGKAEPRKCVKKVILWWTRFHWSENELLLHHSWKEIQRMLLQKHEEALHFFPKFTLGNPG